MDVRTVIKKRKCVKKYLNKPVSDELLFEVLDCARWAQTAMGAQSWEFIIVRDPVKKRKLAEAADQPWIKDAPVVIVVASNLERVEFAIKHKALEMAMFEIAGATQNLQVAARSLVLGSCTAFLFNRETVRQLVGAPPKVIPLAIVPVGYPREFPENSRAPLSEVLHDEEFGRPFGKVPDRYDRRWKRSLFHIFG